MNTNRCRRLYFQAELTKYEAKRLKLHTVGEVEDWLLNADENPKAGKELEYNEELGAVGDFEMEEKTMVVKVNGGAGEFLIIGKTFEEYFEADEDGDFIEGSDFDSTTTFAEEEEKKILDFLEMYS